MQKGDTMQNLTTSATAAAGGLREYWNRVADWLEERIGPSLIALAARFGVAGIFFMSGRTKVDGLLTVNDTAYLLFAEEYQVPLLSPVLAAHLATYAEHLFPILLVLGLATRLSAFSLLMMTAVIQFFVYPSAWPTHLSWAAPMLYLLARGGGKISLDHVAGLK
jgi:putative oxidoreductase